MLSAILFDILFTGKSFHEDLRAERIDELSVFPEPRDVSMDLPPGLETRGMRLDEVASSRGAGAVPGCSDGDPCGTSGERRQGGQDDLDPVGEGLARNSRLTLMICLPA